MARLGSGATGIKRPRAPKAENVRIGRELQKIRKEQGLTAREVAAAIPGMSQGNYEQFEGGRNTLKAVDVPRFARAYNISTDDLLSRLAILDHPSPTTLGHDMAAVLRNLAEVLVAIADQPAADQAFVLEGIAEHAALVREQRLLERRA